MPERTRVALVGASGDTGKSVVQELLSHPDQFVRQISDLTNLEETEKANLTYDATGSSCIWPSRESPKG
jgi:N-acetyl-gamma-glutamylphosphate reductase